MNRTWSFISEHNFMSAISCNQLWPSEMSAGNEINSCLCPRVNSHVANKTACTHCLHFHTDLVAGIIDINPLVAKNV